jgi:two-component sensor histidine kinase
MDIDTGIAPIGRVGWGSHFCHFFRTVDDLSETLVPYFKTGLEQNDACIWVTADPFPKERALAELNTHVPNLGHRLATGQLKILTHSEWYAVHGAKSPNDVAEVWLSAKDQALRDGYRALRLTGNTAFLHADDWDGFMTYEYLLREAFERQKLIALCSYDSRRCDASASLEVIQRHDFALTKARGKWNVIDAADGHRAKAELAVLKTSFDQAVATRTHRLSQALEHQRLLSAEHGHRQKNLIATILSIAEQTLKHAGVADEVRSTLCGRLQALDRVHEQLTRSDWSSVSLRELLAAIAAPYGDRIRIACSDQHLTPRAALDLGLLFNELATNAAKYGGLAVPAAHVDITVESRGDKVRLVWRETAGQHIDKPKRTGFGLKLIQQLITYGLQGDCEMRFEPSGLKCVIEAPATKMLKRREGCGLGGH